MSSVKGSHIATLVLIFVLSLSSIIDASTLPGAYIVEFEEDSSAAVRFLLRFHWLPRTSDSLLYLSNSQQLETNFTLTSQPIASITRIAWHSRIPYSMVLLFICWVLITMIRQSEWSSRCLWSSSYGPSFSVVMFHCIKENWSQARTPSFTPRNRH